MKSWQLAHQLTVALALLSCAFAQAPQGSTSPSSSSLPAPPTFHANTRIVTLEVVARDHHGQPVLGLTADDFQITEQIGSKHDQHLQKIASFRAITVTDIAAHDTGKAQMPPGVYTNFVTMDKHPVPPTILLVDGLNTDRGSQMQVHRQAIRMLASIPNDIPVAVFLLGHNLRMIQDFTTDPALLKSALQTARSAESNEATAVEPQDDPDSMSSFLEDTSDVPAQMLSAIEQFEREAYAAQMDQRVRETLDALRALARHVAGYQGRKNLLWISSSFPIQIDPDVNMGWAGFRNYRDQMVAVVRALADAKVAVYPMDPAGLQTQAMFSTSSRMRGPMTGQRVGAQLEREDQSLYNSTESMETLAEQTGGIVCVNDNDLGDCVRKAVNDGSSFYEIAYYPDSGEWNGEFHKIIIKSNKSGTRLAYRHGYYAQSQAASDQKSADREFQEATCGDVLTSTSILVAAKQYPGDQPGKAKYFITMDPAVLSSTQQSDGSHELALKFGVCTFNKTGKPLQFLQETFDPKLTEKQYTAVLAQRGFPHSFVLEPKPGVVVVRLLVQDVITDKMGSVNIPYTELTATTMPNTSSGGASVPAAPAEH